VTGLRREEVAQLAGGSTDYYTRLEQGRDLSPSDAVLDALARALNLDDAGRAHLQHLAHPARPQRRQTPTVQRVRPAVRSMLDSWTEQPAFVLGRRGDILATNALARALLADFDAMLYRDRNLTRWILLDPAGRELYVDWAQIASEMVAILCLDAVAHADDARTTELVGELTLKSPEFPRWWSQPKVLDRTWGHQALPTPGRRTVGDRLRGTPSARRPRPHPVRLPRTRRRHPLRVRTQTARQLERPDQCPQQSRYAAVSVERAVKGSDVGSWPRGGNRPNCATKGNGRGPAGYICDLLLRRKSRHPSLTFGLRPAPGPCHYWSMQ
jgi:transcriptional regulator with XRE-family HTH domain